MSFKKFDNHIKRMVYGKIIEKKGKHYSLTEEYRNKRDRNEQIDTSRYKYRNRPIDDPV